MWMPWLGSFVSFSLQNPLENALSAAEVEQRLPLLLTHWKQMLLPPAAHRAVIQKRRQLTTTVDKCIHHPFGEAVAILLIIPDVVLPSNIQEYDRKTRYRK